MRPENTQMSDQQYDATRAEALQAAVHLASNNNPLNAYTPNDIVSAADLFHSFLTAGGATVTVAGGVDLEVPF
jgi:hypothetical protein